MRIVKSLGWIAAVPLLVLAGCGEESGGFSLSTGAYKLSNVNFEQDGCALGNAPGLQPGAIIQVSVEGDVITLFTDTGTQPTGTIADDAFDAVASNTIADPEFDCTDKLTKRVRGELTADDTFNATFDYIDEVVSGTQCEELLGFSGETCTTTVTFTATKQE